MLRIIDTSSWKRDIVNTNVDIDGLYTKATEGNYYVDDSCDSIVQWAIRRGKKWGVYHFATNRITSAITEADFFVDNCLGYVNQGMLILDYENYRWSDGTFANDANNVAWAKAWLDHVYARTGVRPLIYMSLSVVTGNDWSPVINAGYGLICAQYQENNTRIDNWAFDPARDPNPRWDSVVNDVMWQFTSSMRLDGYGGNLDANFFYGDAHAWDLYAGVFQPAPTTPEPEPTPPPEVQPVPTPEPETPPSEPVPQAPADPTTPPNENVPTPEPEPSVDPAPVDPATPTPRPPMLMVIKAALLRAFHTFWQTFGATFLAATTGLVSALLSVKSLSEAKVLIVSFVLATGAAALSVLKNVIKPPKETKQ